MSRFLMRLQFNPLMSGGNKRSHILKQTSRTALTQIPLNFKTSCCNLKIRGLEAKLCVAFVLFNFERNYDILMLKSPCFLLKKKRNEPYASDYIRIVN